MRNHLVPREIATVKALLIAFRTTNLSNPPKFHDPCLIIMFATTVYGEIIDLRRPCLDINNFTRYNARCRQRSAKARFVSNLYRISSVRYK